MDLKQKIEMIVAPLLEALDAFIVDIQIASRDQRKAIQLFVDTDAGITIDQCTELSRIIGEALDRQNVVQDSYVLEVSSPDLTKPLKLIRQYRKNVGRQFRLRVRKNGEVIGIKAKLEGWDKEILTFSTNSEGTFKIAFNEIMEAIEELPW